MLSGIKNKNAEPINTPDEIDTTGNKSFFKIFSFKSKIPAAITDVKHIKIPANVMYSKVKFIN